MAATANLLGLLELLQARPLWTGRELAERLAVDRRTVRRYVATLQNLGIPVEGERGAGGGYRLRPGYRLPPLMLDDEEATVVVLGLVGAQRLGLGEPERVEAALAKVRRVLPDRLRARVEALETSLHLTLPAVAGTDAPAGRVLALAEAVHRRRRLLVPYVAADGTPSRRDVTPLGLVVHAGRWYLSAHDHDRDALRTFRVDRLGVPAAADGPAAAAPPGHDPVAHVTASLAGVPWRWRVVVRLRLPVAVARARLPATIADLQAEVEGETTLLRMRAESLDWAATVLAGLDADFEVLEPDELRDSVAGLADRLARQVAPAPRRRGTPT